MSKEFMMVQCATRFNEHLSRERFNLKKMWDNPNVSESLYVTRLNQFNELVSTLNALYSALTGSDADMFAPEPDYAPEPVETYTPEPVVYAEPEPVALVSSVDPTEGESRADAALREYEASSEQDIALHDPSEHVPVSVLPEPVVRDTDDADAEDELDAGLDEEADDEPDDPREDDPYAEDDLEETEVVDEGVPTSGWLTDEPAGTTGGSYITHTTAGVRVDNDPTQIAQVETAVERDNVSKYVGVGIDVTEYRGASASNGFDDVLDDDLANLRVGRE